MPDSVRTSMASRSAVFAPLTGAGRAAQVEKRLRDAIVLGMLTPGEKLPTESELSRQFGVAVVTAREALEALRDQGLVVTRRGRGGGSFVAATRQRLQPLIDERLRDISRLELRDMGVHYTAIAAQAAEIAADRATDDDVENLRRIVAAIDTSSESAARRGESTVRLEIAALSQSARLVREELRLQPELGSMLWLGLRDQQQRDIAKRHNERIVAAIAATDGEQARRITTQHIGQAVEWLVEAKAELDDRD